MSELEYLLAEGVLKYENGQYILTEYGIEHFERVCSHA